MEVAPEVNEDNGHAEADKPEAETDTEATTDKAPEADQESEKKDSEEKVKEEPAPGKTANFKLLY